MSLSIGRAVRVTVIIIGLILGFTAIGITHRSIARADNPPTSGPSPERAMADMSDEVADVGQSLGGFTDDEKIKVAAMLKSVGDQFKADPSKFPGPELERTVFTQLRDTLNPDHQKKFDDMMAESRKNAIMIKTASNLRQVGQLCLLYTNDNPGKIPADLGALTSEKEASPGLFLAGDSKTTLPDDWDKMDAKAKADWVNKNTEFVYLAGGLSSAPDLNFVVAYIKPEASLDGNAFLLGDGSIHSEPADVSKAIIEDLKAGKNPPPSLKKD